MAIRIPGRWLQIIQPNRERQRTMTDPSPFSLSLTLSLSEEHVFFPDRDWEKNGGRGQKVRNLYRGHFLSQGLGNGKFDAQI